MQFDYLQQFLVRMKKVGAYALLFRNSFAKQTWKTYGFEAYYEQVNVLFSVLLYIMEASLKEEVCTIDDIANFIDTVNMQYYKKVLSYESARELASFIVDTILGNEGRPMYFDGFCYETGEFEPLYVSFIGNKIVYLDSEVKRTSYFLSEEGYALMLSTLEIDSHLQLTIQEMIFQLHLEKATYDRAVDDVKQIFNLLRIQFQKIESAMRKIRQNALAYSVSEYREIVGQNLEIIEQTKVKFSGYRGIIRNLLLELEDKNITIEKLSDTDSANVGYLKVIEHYLNQVLDEHQRILNAHFDLKNLYTKELEGLTQMSMIQRFNFRSDVYDQLLSAPDGLANIETWLRPLFMNGLDKTYNLEKVVALQKPIGKKREEEAFFTTVNEQSDTDFAIQQQMQQLAKYEQSLSVIFRYLLPAKRLSLSELHAQISEVELAELIPTVEIFKEVMVELLQVKVLDVMLLRFDAMNHLSDTSYQFQLPMSVLNVLERDFPQTKIVKIHIYRSPQAEVVRFRGVYDTNGQQKAIECSNLILEVE